MSASRPLRDPTVAAVPFYFATMAAERVVMRRRARTGSPSAGDYERRDTIASLTMGTISLIAPLVGPKLLRPLTPGRGRFGRAIVAGALGAVVATSIADAVAKRRDRSSTAGRVARRVASTGGVASVALGGVAVATVWQDRTSMDRMWNRRPGRRRISRRMGLAAAIAGWDFIYYWNHRFMHESRYMWAIHVVHHSSEHYNLSTALRQPVLDALGTPVPYGALCLIGIDRDQVLLARGINLLYQYWIHTEAIRRLGPGEAALNTPSHHRVHHGSNLRYIDRNHGSILIIWDRLFGTFEPEGEEVVYGLTKNIGSFGIDTIATHEFRAILADVARSTGWRERISYVVRGPGWADRHRRLLADPLAAREADLAGLTA
ncbi:MAG TPA: sterol desaturase family protein [Acidimicrobiales bacterium]|jgi:sterol desaturase/sphingolipid hydroxylase (fatty acid hydroxylase superfamily)|nr:sterol desaturase family protein [Acidimicrobiales bacterium]